MKRSAWLPMVVSTLLFAAMGVCVKLASSRYSVAEIVGYRGLVGGAAIAVVAALRGNSLKTRLPAAHFWRSLTGVCSLGLWFHAIGQLPLATAITLNYTSSVWVALFLIGGAAAAGGVRVDPRLVATVLVGFAGVGFVLRPTLGGDQLWSGLLGLLSGLLAALAYLQIAALGRTGEPGYRIVFYFCVGGALAGALAAPFGGGLHAHTPGGLALLLAIGALATLAQLMLTRAYAVGTVLVNASLQYLGIGWSFLFGVLLFDDPVTAAALLGMGLIVVAGLAATRLSHAADGRAAATAATGPADGPNLDLDAPTAQGADR